MKRPKRNTATPHQTDVTTERVRAPRAPCALRRTSIWNGITQTSTWVRLIAEWAHDGGPKVPPFQRRIVWTEHDELLLADSIDCEIPIGTLMIWAPGWRGAGGPTDEWIVDGQQRVSALGRMSRGETRIHFDCDDDRYVLVDVPDPLRHVPIAAMFQRSDTYSFSDAMFANGHDDADDDTYYQMRDRVRRLTSACDRLLDARVSLIVIRKDDESLVREIFRRINTSGKPMSEEDVFAGLARCKP